LGIFFLLATNVFEKRIEFFVIRCKEEKKMAKNWKISSNFQNHKIDPKIK